MTIEPVVTSTSQLTDSKPRILIADDSRVVRVSLNNILRDEYGIIEAEDGSQAWTKLLQEPDIELILSDLSMPNLDGMELLRRIRLSENNQIRETPFIVITGKEDDAQIRTQLLDEGATELVTKPFDAEVISACAKKHTAKLGLAPAKPPQPEAEFLRGIINRTQFSQIARKELSFAIRNKNELVLALLQINQFEAIAKHYSESAIEHILITMAEIIRVHTHIEDKLAYFGDGTFAILLPATNAIGTRHLGRRILSDLVAKQFYLGESETTVTASMGISAPEIKPGTTFSEILSLAEQRLLASINAGGNRVVDKGSANLTAVSDLVEDGPDEDPVQQQIRRQTEVEMRKLAAQEVNRIKARQNSGEQAVTATHAYDELMLLEQENKLLKEEIARLRLHAQETDHLKQQLHETDSQLQQTQLKLQQLRVDHETMRIRAEEAQERLQEADQLKKQLHETEGQLQQTQLIIKQLGTDYETMRVRAEEAEQAQGHLQETKHLKKQLHETEDQLQQTQLKLQHLRTDYETLRIQVREIEESETDRTVVEEHLLQESELQQKEFNETKQRLEQALALTSDAEQKAASLEEQLRVQKDAFDLELAEEHMMRSLAEQKLADLEAKSKSNQKAENTFSLTVVPTAAHVELEQPKTGTPFQQPTETSFQAVALEPATVTPAAIKPVARATASPAKTHARKPRRPWFLILFFLVLTGLLATAGYQYWQGMKPRTDVPTEKSRVIPKDYSKAPASQTENRLKPAPSDKGKPQPKTTKPDNNDQVEEAKLQAELLLRQQAEEEFLDMARNQVPQNQPTASPDDSPVAEEYPQPAGRSLQVGETEFSETASF